MCERSNYGLSGLQRKSWNCGDARVMDLLFGLMHGWRSSGDHTFPFVCRSGGKLGELPRDISDNQASGESAVALLRVGRFTARWSWRRVPGSDFPQPRLRTMKTSGGFADHFVRDE